MITWDAREDALRALKGELAPEAELLNDLFGFIDQAVDEIEGAEGAFARLAALLMLKARNLALGCYSLSLDALAQEAGALFRPLMEACEALAYFRADPSRVEQALRDGMPQAGKVAKAIKGPFESLRKQLNKNAAHISIHPNAMNHLFDWETGTAKKVQQLDVRTLKYNLQVLSATILCLAVEAVKCVALARLSNVEALESRVDELLRLGDSVITLEGPEPS